MAAAASRELKIAVVGATGAVGGQIVELLDARAVPCAELGLFATERGASQKVEAFGRENQVVELREPSDLARFDIALLAVPPSVAADIIRDHPGPALIDLSAAIRPPSKVVPTIAPGFTAPEQTAGFAARGNNVAIAHPAAHVLAMVIAAAGAQDSAACVTLILGASSEGRQNVEDVAREAGALLSGAHSLEEGETQRAFNAYPAETNDDLSAAVCAQVGALIGTAPRLMVEAINVSLLHGAAMTVLIPDPLAPDLAARIRPAPGLLTVEGEDEGASVIDAIGQEAVLVSVRTHTMGASIWCAFDNVRLAALDAIWVVEKLAAAGPPGAA